MIAFVLLAFASVQAPAHSAAHGGWKVPPADIVAVLDAPTTPDLSISPDGRWMLSIERRDMPTLADVLRPWIPLAGARVDPTTSMPRQLSFARGLRLRAIEGGGERRLDLPADVRIGDVSWSPLSDRIVYTRMNDDEAELWTADTQSFTPVKLAARVGGVLGRPFDWSADGASVLARVLPSAREDAPAANAVPAGPSVQESGGGRKTALRTYQDLLRDPRDEALFERHARTQLVRIAFDQNVTTVLGAPDLIADAESSPDGRWLLVTRIVRPYSYVLPAGLFARTIELWSADGKLVRTIADVPLGDAIPIDGVRTGPRNVQWQPTLPASLVWVEALDGGDPKTKADKRDRWMRFNAPFEAPAEKLFELTQRARDLRFLADGRNVVASEFDRDRRWLRSALYDLSKPGTPPRVLEDRSINDRYGDPGQLASTVGELGRTVVRQDGPFVYRIGMGAQAGGARPFLDRENIETGQRERLWQSSEDSYEALVAITRSAFGKKPAFVTSHETPTEVPNYRARDLEAGTWVALTRYDDPQPALRGIKRELVKYQRADGVELSATLYLPPDWKEGTRLPLFVWAYPNEFTDAGTAGQITTSPQRFVRVRGPSQILLALAGYAVLDNASMPVVGDPETVNDTFLAQIVANAQAAIDFAVERGCADRERVAVGGHSYGAFMTANLLAHCDLFKAGVARSGAYNRTLTPFGFQSERRTLWEAPKAYLELSPFLVAHKIEEPLLLVHGERDDNMGTFPMQSERLFQAIQGNGGRAKLVVLPGESHGYAARESVLHVVAETIEFLERTLKSPASEGSSRPAEAGAPR